MNTRLTRTALAAALLLGGACSACADVVTDWNSLALNATHFNAGGNPFMQLRVLAQAHAAMADALNAVERRHAAYAIELKAAPGASADAAVASAAHTVLVANVPAQRPALDAALANSLSKVADGAGKSDGVALGRQVAEQLLALRAGDGYANKVTFQIPAPGPGVWQQTPGFGPMLFYNWSQTQPMAIRNLKDYDLGGPPALSSEQWARDYNEVKSLGGRRSTARTAEQTEVAMFWTIQSAVAWNSAAQAASKARSLSLHDNARLFALLNIAMNDAAVVGFEQKARYNFWRPYTAIRYSGGPAQAGLVGDPNWEPLLNTPGFQDYPSAHCVFAGAAASVLLAFFPDDKVDVSVTHPPLAGTTHRWSSFTQMTREIEDARVWAGIHFRTADEHGTRIGRKIGADVVATQLKPLP